MPLLQNLPLAISSQRKQPQSLENQAIEVVYICI